MEISEKEQKSIANFKYWIDTNTKRGVCYLPDYICAKVLNLIEKLQKENEELKDFKKQVTDIESTNFIKYKNYISIQKVKDKIEELNNNRQYLSQFKDYKEKNYTNEEVVNNCVEVLQELLESE